MMFFNFKNKKESVKNSEKLYASSRSFQPVGTKRADGRYVSAEELYDFIADFFSKQLESYGFKYLKSKKTFKRITGTGCDEICISFVDHVHYHVNFNFAKRIDSVQKIITAAEYENDFNTNSNYKEHYTVSVTYGNMVGQRDIEIISYYVLEKELPRVLALIEKEIIPYFDKLNSVDFLHQTLNYPEKDNKNPFSYFAVNGSADSIITGLIIAKTLNDANYENLFNSNIEKYPQNLVLKEQLIKLNEYLKHKKLEK